MDGEIPNCRTPAGCDIPALEKEGRRALKIYDLLGKLHNVVDPGTICRLCDVDLVDLVLLAVIAESGKEGTKHGEGH